METKPDILDNIELRSDSVQDILTKPPHWMVRWGNTLILVLMLMVLMMSYFIKYPEFISAPIIVTSQNPPEKIISRTNSKVEKILVKDQQPVKKGDVLMILQSTANYKDVLELKKLVDSLPAASVSSFPLSLASKFRLGELQGDYNSFAKALQDQQLFARLKPYSPESTAVTQGVAETNAQIATLSQQLGLENAKLDLSRKNYDRSQSLFSQGVISKMELENERIKFLQAQQSVKSINLSIAQLRGNITNLNKTKGGVEINTQKDQINYSTQSLQLFEQLRKSLRAWEQNFLIVSSTNGIVSFPQFYGENQFVKAGDALISVLPDDKSSLVGRMEVPSVNSGKIVPGQKVLVKLDNFRYQEYGIVQGKVVNMSLTPNENGNYYVGVILPYGLKTSYNKTLTFDKELKGNAEIVTKDLRLIERLFYQLKELLGYQA